MNRSCYFWVLLPALVAGCTAPRESSAQQVIDRQLGVNLANVVDWSSEWPFVDVYKTSRPWMEKGPGPFTYDAAGNPLLRPGQSVKTLIFRDLDGHYPAGEYVATYQGTGEVEINQYDVEEVVSARPGRIVVRVKPGNGGILIKILRSSPRDPIRNLHVWAPGFENTKSPYHPVFCERLQPFRVLRFMDWQRTNGSPLSDWSQRPKPDDARFSTDLGLPLEVMIDLSNVQKVNPWFCIPHQADDEFVRAFAKMVKDRLDPNLKAHIEYSNEVWNWGFAQTKYAEQHGKKLGREGPPHLRYYAKRSVEIFDIFTEVFGGNERLVRVLSGQFANPRDCEFILTSNDAYRKADAFGVGAYFGYEFGAPKNVEATLKLSAEEILKRCGQEIDGTHRELIRRHSATAKKYNLRLVAYEGGQHLVGHGGAENNKPLEDLLIACNRHPKMASLYRQQVTHWFAEGGDTFVAFGHIGQPSKWGSWGLLEFQDQDIQQAPKYRAFSELAGELTGKMTATAMVGVVVIGRNEGERLPLCLKSVIGNHRIIVYVDSGSTDDSTSLAQSLGVTVIELDLTIPFTAARARNAGWHKLTELSPATRFVQFVDGDCEVCAGWLDAAMRAMHEHHDVVAVCGRRRERFPEASLYNRLCDLEWDTPIGPADSCGGDALFRLGPLHAVAGYRDSMIAGEEPELCLRLRNCGGTILRIDHEMTLHDAAMTTFGQWWTRAVRAGHAYGEGAHLTITQSPGLWHHEVISTILWAVAVPLIAIACARWTQGLSLLLFLAYPLLWLRIALRWRHRWPGRDARTYATFCVIAKFAHAVGWWRFHRNRLFGRRSRLIEYKQAAPVVSQPS